MTSTENWWDSEQADLRKLFVNRPTGQSPILVLCPFHKDSNPSYAVYKSNAYCYACRKYEKYREFVERVGFDPRELGESDPPLADDYLLYARRDSKSSKKDPRETDTPTIEELTRVGSIYHERLLGNKEKLDYLKSRGLSEVSISQAWLGYTGRAYSIPIFNESFDKLSTIRFRRDDSVTKSGSKYWGTAGLNKAYLYAPCGIKTNSVILCEGEFDCLLCNQLGIQAITITNGVNSLDVNILLENLSEVSCVGLLLDMDGPGFTTALQTKRELIEAGKQAKIIRLKQVKDLTDFVKRSGETAVRLFLKSEMSMYEPERDYLGE